MPKIQSEIRSLNRHIQQIADIFGLDSNEYMTAKKQIQYYFRNIADSEYYNKKGVLQIHQSNKIFSSDKAVRKAEAVRKIQRKQGTAKQMEKSYKEDLKLRGEKPTKEKILEEAKRRFEMQKESESYYTQHENEIRSDRELYKLWSDAGKNATWQKGKVNAAYEKAVEATKNRKQRRSERKKTKNVKSTSSKFTKKDFLK